MGSPHGPNFVVLLSIFTERGAARKGQQRKETGLDLKNDPEREGKELELLVAGRRSWWRARRGEGGQHAHAGL